MRQRTSTSIPFLHGVFAPVLSLDALIAGDDADAGPRFDIPDDGLRVDQWLEQLQAESAVTDFVASLAPRDQAIVRRLFWQEDSQTEIAASFGVSKMAVSKAMARISKQGRAALADHRYPETNH